MGAQGYKIFDDDIAYDVLSEIDECNDIKCYVSGVFDMSASAEYLEYDDGIAVLVCSALLDYLYNGPRENYRAMSVLFDYNSSVNIPSRFNEFLKSENINLLVQKSIISLARVRGENSELCDLWAESEQLYPKWLNNISQISERLSGNLR